MKAKLAKLCTPKKVIISIWAVFLSFWGGILIFTLAVLYNWFGWFGEIPGFEVLENPETDLATIVYAEDGEILGKYYSTRRTNVAYESISIDVFRTLIATEDERFEHHSGVDMRSTFRVIGGLLTGRRAGGGSTISQQLAKNLFGMRKDSVYTGSLYETKARMLIVKAKEWITARRLERAYSKKEIITMYLNTVRFGLEAVGINEAAQTYFNKSPKKLNLLESATMIGTLKANTLYDPKRNPDTSKHRRNVVISQLHKYSEKYQKDYLTEAQKDSLFKEPLKLDFQQQDYMSGLATHFRAMVKPELERICDKLNYNLQTEGLKVYTTIDYKLQKKAESAVISHLSILQKKFLKEWGNKDPWSSTYIKRSLLAQPFYKSLINQFDGDAEKVKKALHTPREVMLLSYDYEKQTIEEKRTEISPYDEFIHYKKFLQTGFLVIDPHTGAVKSWVGGIDQKRFAYDHVKQGRRQPGSTFKPILYSAAINNGYSPCDRILDAPVTARTPDDKVWIPKIKATNKEISLKRCLANSLNNCAALLIRDIGPKNVIKHAEQLGIPKGRLSPNLSLALGTDELNMFELIRPYMAFANHGTLKEPFYIQKIADKNGKTIWENTPKSSKVMNEVNAYKMLTMLREGVKSGTGTRIQRDFKLLDNSNQVGGKTGTTNDSKDGWFVGLTKDFVCVAWVGVDDNAINFRHNNRWYGGVMALPIVGKFLKSTLLDPTTGFKPGPFQVPNNITDNVKAKHLICNEDLSNYDLDIEVNELDLAEFGDN